ncbi:hypothetical protein KEM54_005778 [Ascosphaera aggregata]|nr:hypothetical protein KEM54_005778 [Ascosphaera aggregata]
MSGEIVDGESPCKRRKITPSTETGPYVLRRIIGDVPIAADGAFNVNITCVEYWVQDGNLYIGTSAGEILHFVSLPPDPSDQSDEPQFMIASRLPIAGTDDAAGQGIQQILLVPSSNKACILCNGAVTFYELPELSPTYRGARVAHCKWIGETTCTEDAQTGETVSVIMVAMDKKIMLVKIGEEPRRIRNIEFPGCLVASRRDSIACVADSHMYSLIELDQKEKIPLFSISSSAGGIGSDDENDRPGPESTALLAPETRHGEHSRSSSTNSATGSSPASSPSFPSQPDSGAGLISYGSSPSRSHDYVSKPLPSPPPARLKPHIISPTPSEFLLLTGTKPDETGVGMFVNIDGEVVRGTLEFSHYPESIIIDDVTEGSQAQASSIDEGGYVLAVINHKKEEGSEIFIEAQRWSMNPGEGERQKHRLELPTTDETSPANSVGMRHTIDSSRITFREISDVLRLVRLKLPTRDPLLTPDPRTIESIEQYKQENALFERDGNPTRPSSGDDWEVQRNEEELKFAQGLSYVDSSILLWHGNCIWRVLRNPLALQLENTLRSAVKNEADQSTIHESSLQSAWDADAILAFLLGLEEIEPKTESEFLGLGYVKQKASLLLFIDLLHTLQTQTADLIQATENALVEGNLDPRLVLLFVPLLREEVLLGPQGIWIYNGLARITEPYLASDANVIEGTSKACLSDEVLHMIRRYLLSWQKKRGYGSITDETYVFDSVDAALLHLLLDLDQKAIAASNTSESSTIRYELYKLVDHWKGDFERAAKLLGRYKRLFVLSRLYQSRKMAKQVLETWKRIVEGEEDVGGELSPEAVDMQLRRYLVRLRDARLVEDYGIWLASRNPKLAVEVFSDDQSRVKFDPPTLIKMLKEYAPEAVQKYLEHLVFGKNYYQYADDLIAYYLDTVLSVLETSPEARQSLADSYSTYRALQPPKPSYLSFITHNCPQEAWWKSRLRLLQLLGGSTSSQYTSQAARQLTNISYSIPTVLSRIEPFQNVLVSESIILGGRQGKHREALHLLVHGLGDYDTAIRYCLIGSPSSSLSLPSPTPTPTPTSSKDALSPSTSQQHELFSHLLTEFLRISDPEECINRTASLLERFAPMYDIKEVLALIPESWGIHTISGYLVRVLRSLVSEAHETQIQRALSASLYLQTDIMRINELEKGELCSMDKGDGIQYLGKGVREAESAVGNLRLDGENPLE